MRHTATDGVPIGVYYIDLRALHDGNSFLWYNAGMQTDALPETFRPLLWSYDFSRIDPLKHKKTIIVQALNYGTLTHWRWLIQNYGREEVRDVLTHIPATEIKPRSLRLASLVFGVERFNYAPRGTN